MFSICVLIKNCVFHRPAKFGQFSTKSGVYWRHKIDHISKKFTSIALLVFELSRIFGRGASNAPSPGQARVNIIISMIRYNIFIFIFIIIIYYYILLLLYIIIISIIIISSSSSRSSSSSSSSSIVLVVDVVFICKQQYHYGSKNLSCVILIHSCILLGRIHRHTNPPTPKI